MCVPQAVNTSGAVLQVINRDKNDLDARWDRAVLYSEVDEPRKVCIANTLTTCANLAKYGRHICWKLWPCSGHTQ